MVGIWLCHIPTLHHDVRFPPGGNLTGGNMLGNHNDDDDDDDDDDADDDEDLLQHGLANITSDNPGAVWGQ